MRAFVLCFFLLTACVHSSGVLPLGPDTYLVSVRASVARGGEPEATRMAFEEAQRHCTGKGREFLFTDLGSGPSHLADGTVDLMFQCLQHGDPALQQRPANTTR